MKKINDIDINDLISEYSPNEDIFTSDNVMMVKLKRIIMNDLDEIDKRVILLYADLSSQRKVADILGVSTSTVNNKIKEIREKIINRL